MPIPSTVLLEAGLVPKPYVVLFVDSIFNRLLNEGFVQCRGWLMGIHLCLTFLNRKDLPTLISRTSIYPVSGVFVVVFSPTF